MSENEDTKISKSEIREIKQQLSKIQTILESDAFKEKLDFIETHNKIIKSLSEAEKGHAKTLNSFLEELQKRIVTINELNIKLSHTSTISNNLNSKLNDFINMVNFTDENFVKYNRDLTYWVDKAGKTLVSEARYGVGKISQKFRRYIFINTACNIIISFVLLYFYIVYLKK